MATIYCRKNNDDTSTYRVQIRRKGIPFLNLAFSSQEEAEDWVNENEQKYIKNPEPYLKWIDKERLNLRRKREFNNEL